MPSIEPETSGDEVHVAIGIIRDGEQCFVTRRPDHAHLGGLWEFPGGKCLPGEGVEVALARELEEELGIEVHAAVPTMQVRHVYPGKRVWLDVWSVTDYAGVPHGREGQTARWFPRHELLTLDMPEADRPIQRRLWLPDCYGISDVERYGLDGFLDRLGLALAAGLRLVQLREPGLALSSNLLAVREIVARCHAAGAVVLLNERMISGDAAWIVETGADGIHLTSRALAMLEARPLGERYFVAASCHDEIELAKAARIGVDFAVLSQIQATASHPDAVPVGWEALGRACARFDSPIYALGGMQRADIARAHALGAYGVAMKSGAWSGINP